MANPYNLTDEQMNEIEARTGVRNLSRIGFNIKLPNGQVIPAGLNPASAATIVLGGGVLDLSTPEGNRIADSFRGQNIYTPYLSFRNPNASLNGYTTQNRTLSDSLQQAPTAPLASAGVGQAINYVNINGAYFQRTAEGMKAVNNPNILAGLRNGSIASSSGTIQDLIGNVINSIGLNAQLNPAITEADIANMKWQDFMEEARRIVSPQFKEKTDASIKDFLTVTNRSEEDLNYNLGRQQKSYESSLASGQENYSDRGLAFSGARNKFESDLSASNSAEQNRQRILAFREAQDALNTTERALGTPALTGTLLPSVGGRSLSLSSSPLVGANVYTQQSQEQDLARKLDQERRTLAYYNLNKIPA